MTRKDYVLLAWVVDRVRNDFIGSHDGQLALRSVAEGMCSIFQENNSRFDRTRFLNACGMVDVD